MSKALRTDYRFKRYVIDRYATINEAELFVLPINPNLACIHTAIIPNTERRAIARYHLPLDRYKRLLARSFLLEYVRDCYHCLDLDIVYTTYHRPVFKASDIHFSFSYTQDYVVLALAEKRCLGVDIAFHDPQLAVQSLVTLVMSAAEREQFALLGNDKQQKIFFYRIWSLKEAILKAWGIGLLHDDITALDVVSDAQCVVTYANADYRYCLVPGLDDHSIALSVQLGNSSQ